MTENAFVEFGKIYLANTTIEVFISGIDEVSTLSRSNRLLFDLNVSMIKGLADEIMHRTRSVGDAIAALKEGEHTFENTALGMALHFSSSLFVCLAASLSLSFSLFLFRPLSLSSPSCCLPL